MDRRTFLETSGLALGAAPLAGSQTGVPTRAQTDALTNTAGTEYFLLGNGYLAAAVQSGGAAHCGLVLTSPAHFGHKPASYLYTERTGLAASRVGLSIDGTLHFPGRATVSWEYPGGVPTVRLDWEAGGCTVTERLWCAADDAALLREIHVRNRGTGAVEVRAAAPFRPNPLYFDEYEDDGRTLRAGGYATLELFAFTTARAVERQLDIGLGRLARGAEASATLAWALDGAAASVRGKGVERLRAEAAAKRGRAARFDAQHPGLNHLFRVAQNGIRCAVARSGKMDGGPLQYNLEWVRDSVMVASGAVMAGMPEIGEAVLDRILTRCVAEDGRTADSGSHRPDGTIELDQNGELLYALRTHWVWTGDDRLLRAHWPRIRTAGDFVLRPVFRDPAIGLVRNRRELWERGPSHGVRDGYELAYQAWDAMGLEMGAELAAHVGDSATAGRWSEAASLMRTSMLSHPRFSLVQDGHLIKRRNVDGTPQLTMEPPDRSRIPAGMPLREEAVSYCDPDATLALPMAFGQVDPQGELARRTLARVEKLWNQRWTGGGYGRYDVTSEPDSPGPWPFATLFVLRAYLEAGDDEKVWRGLDWLLQVPGGRAGTWFEFYGDRPSPPLPPVAYIPWTWAEMVTLLVHHLLGVRPSPTGVTIRPRLLAGIDGIDATLRVNGHALRVRVVRGGKLRGPVKIPRPDTDVELTVGV
jgi:hypothetical protein